MNCKLCYKCPILALCLALMLSMLPVLPPAHATTRNSTIIVSLGDSYSSGEGIEPFYGQGDTIDVKAYNSDWLAHRSQNSWPGMLTLPSVNGKMAENRNKNWFFVAASGAETYHMNNPQGKPVKRKTGWLLDSTETTYSQELPPQLSIFNTLASENKHADYVTLTLGGNDAGFASIVVDAATGCPYLDYSGLHNQLEKSIGSVFDDFDGRIRTPLKTAYTDISSAAGPQATILVVGYPKLLSSKGSGLPYFLSYGDATWINSAVTRFNGEISDLVDECRASGMSIYFVSVEEAFSGHGAYDSDAYLNGVVLPAQSEDLDNSSFVSAYSMHPNYQGAQAYAGCVQKTIYKLENGTMPMDKLTARPTAVLAESYYTSDFSIVGSWKSIGSYGFGQAQPGSTVSFDGTHCNFYSPYDTYSFYYQDGQWHLDCRNFLFGDVTEFTVQIVNNDYIKIDFDGSITELQRVGGSASQQTSSGQSSTEPYELLTCLQTAYNTKDIYGLIQCFDPTFTETVLSVVEIMGIDSDLIMELMPFASEIITEYGDVDFDQLGTIEFTPLSCYVNDYEGNITYRATMTVPGHGSESVEETVGIVKVDGTWYFSIYDVGSIGDSSYSSGEDEPVYGALSDLPEGQNVEATAAPTAIPTAIPTQVPTVVPTAIPTAVPIAVSTAEPTPHTTLAALSDDLEYRVEVRGDKVNVRSSPSKDGKLIKTTTSGHSFILIAQPEYDRDGVAWYNIRNSSGETGWISSQFCEIVIVPKATEVPSDYGEDEDFFADGDEDNEFDFEEAFDNIDNEEYWFDIEDAEESEAYGFVRIVNCDSWVSLRSKPSKKASRVAKVPLGDEVEAYAYNDEFCLCYYQDKKGYILKKYLDLY